MTAFRKISAASKGRLIRAYLSESTALDDAVDALHEACGPALAAISPQDAARFFRHRGYVVPINPKNV